jgi:hypothetical protein
MGALENRFDRYRELLAALVALVDAGAMLRAFQLGDVF